ncbi:hypothetical protein HAZT_HAZT004834 [Hyalella azteca]|uniref:G-protein coupled receptors family 1 profile domain-containing protein n=1 Tax=Hyalella azteca TaxID=294128 RepID=A0A6A0GTD5_HYAAZ|nr:hypothetical protein HAZT_HAZT004834 [Hyalella azteca]
MTPELVRQTLLLRCLATNDLVALLGSCLQMYVTLYFRVGSTKWSCAVRVVLRVFGLGSGFVALAMAVERWLALSHPFFYQKQATTAKLTLKCRRSDQNVTPGGLLKFVLGLWGTNAALVCCPLLGFGLWYDETLARPCARYRDASRPGDVAYAYLVFCLGMVMCAVIVACNVSVIKVLCHVGRSRNEPMRCSRASYAMQKQSSFSRDSYRSSKKMDRPPDGHEGKIDEELPLVGNETQNTDPKEKTLCMQELRYSDVDVDAKCKIQKVEHEYVQTNNQGSTISKSCYIPPNPVKDADKPTLMEQESVSFMDASSKILRRSSSVSISKRYKHATHEEQSFAKLMTVLSIVFLICWMPQFFTIPASQQKWFGDNPKVFRIADILIALNFVINPYVYVILRRRRKQKRRYIHECGKFCRSCTSSWRSVTCRSGRRSEMPEKQQASTLQDAASLQDGL